MDKKFLDIAFYYAEKAFQSGEVPVGAVIVKNNEVISYGYNLKEKKQSVFCHAEMIAIEKAAKILENWRLNDCDLYVTLDPCPMCASAIKQSRINNVYSALSNLDCDNYKIIEMIFSKDKINSSVNFVTNLDIYRSKKLLNDFFEKKRKIN